MNAIFIEARQLLLDRRLALLRLAGDQIGTSAEVFVRDAGDESRSRDILLLRLSESLRRDVAQIDAALTRIDAGTYGECDRCGRAIGRQRLRAIPEARLCVTCRSIRALEQP